MASPTKTETTYFLPVDNIESEKSLPYVKLYKKFGDVPIRYNTILEVKIKDAKNGKTI